MQKIVRCEKQVEPILPNGTYSAILEKTEIIKTQYGNRASFVFRVLGVEGSPQIFKSTKTDLNPQSELYEVVSGLLDRDLNSGELEGFNLEVLESELCCLFVEQARSKDGYRFNNITKVFK